MTQIVGIAGSLRRDSYNRRLIASAAKLAPQSSTLWIGSIEGIPIYNGDAEAEEGLPEPVQKLKERIAESHALLIATPEYNGSIPGPLKNAIDWLTRPPKDIRRVFGKKPVGVIGATPGRAGTRLSQTAFLPVFRALGMRPYFEKSLYVSAAADVFDGARLVDDKIKKMLEEYMTGFVSFASAHRGD